MKKMLATALGAVTAIVLLAGCTHYYYDRYAYGYGNYGYYGNRYYGDRYWANRNCWTDKNGVKQCPGPY